jgi:hypothetical protein
VFQVGFLLESLSLYLCCLLALSRAADQCAAQLLERKSAVFRSCWCRCGCCVIGLPQNAGRSVRRC